MAWTWTKIFSNLDDGQILTGQNLGDIQTDITNNAVDLTSVQTISGNKTFSGNVSFTGSLTNVATIVEYVFYDDEMVSYENEAVVYQ